MTSERPTPSAKAALLRRRVITQPTWITTSGDSMGRAVVGGERVLVVGDAAPRRGEIWAFVDADSKLVVHRFRSQQDDLCWFCGDRNSVDDRPVETSSVVGRVVAIERGLRYRKVGVISRLVGHARLDVRSARQEFRKLVRR